LLRVIAPADEQDHIIMVCSFSLSAAVAIKKPQYKFFESTGRGNDFIYVMRVKQGSFSTPAMVKRQTTIQRWIHPSVIPAITVTRTKILYDRNMDPHDSLNLSHGIGILHGG
jgi:hypothetical protein